MKNPQQLALCGFFVCYRACYCGSVTDKPPHVSASPAKTAKSRSSTAHYLNLGELLVALIEESGERKQRRGGKRPEHKEGSEHDRLQSGNI
ncbi:hypothetical protein G3N95_33115 [Paraburkholderia sp. Tr-20389]|uniref:hypothetical protein n=1 Tax=Paraburkholderia sp. Tr-20389 TaxID=2703903 RepID=UPI00197F418D|nr:hypothetical protein [Paraburkholderia sp. Tr-20389]MBN3757803.1 hypothetical protein [Paraburkholderia sp. Tr-20389]